MSIPISQFILTPPKKLFKECEIWESDPKPSIPYFLVFIHLSLFLSMSFQLAKMTVYSFRISILNAFPTQYDTENFRILKFIS